MKTGRMGRELSHTLACAVGKLRRLKRQQSKQPFYIRFSANVSKEIQIDF
jgi:hypothetical protein